MYYKVETTSDKLPQGVGGYNDRPPNVREITEERFWFYHSTYAPTGIDHRWTEMRDGGPRENVVLFFSTTDRSEGYGFVRGKERPAWFFSFTVCEHEWKHDATKSRMCYHVSRCTKCGKENAVDSSG